MLPTRSPPPLSPALSTTSYGFPAASSYSFETPRRRRRSATTGVTTFFKRLFSRQQMDFEVAMSQMFYLCFSPKRVYRFVGYHRQTKNQWARDDPAFLALLVICLTITAIVYGIVYHQGFLGTLKLILWMVFVDYILVGCIIATVLWFFCNKFLLHHPLHTPVQRAEWAYCFDVHSNAFFPMFLITYVLQLILIPVVTRDAWISTFVGNTMYLIAMSWYIYVTYLGYNVLPFLKSQNIFLYPLPLIFIFYVGSLFGYNVPKHVLNMYFG